MNLGFQEIWKNQYITPVKAGYLQPQTSHKNTLGHFSVHYDNTFGSLFDFSERNMLLDTSYWKVITQSSFTELGMVVNRYGSQRSQNTLRWTLRTLPSERFTPWNGVICPWALLDSFLTTGTFAFCSHGICSLMAEAACLYMTAGWWPS